MAQFVDSGGLENPDLAGCRVRTLALGEHTIEKQGPRAYRIITRFAV
jgi:hypothetical protein